MAVACGEPAPCPEGEDAGLRGEKGQVYCELYELIDAAWGAQKQELLDCLDEFSAGEREDMLAAMEAATDEELADLILDYAKQTDCYDEDWNAH